MLRLLAGLIAPVILALGAMACLPLLREKAAQKRQQLELEELIRVEQTRERELVARIAAIKADPRAVEKLAREKLGLVRSNEVMFKFRADLP